MKKDVLDVKKDLSREKKEVKKKNRAVIGLSIATGVLALSTIGLGVGVAISQSQAMSYRGDLESVYQKSMYELVDSVNNTETKLAKVLSSDGSAYQKKMLLEVSKNTNEAQGYISSLPLSQSDIQETVKMVNQISGYTSTLAEKLSAGGTLTESEMDTLADIHQNIVQMKQELNTLSRKMENGYNLMDESLDFDGDMNMLTQELEKMHDVDVDYPTMIYDGPFSDSVVSAQIKGLSGANINQDEALERINSSFKNLSSVEFENQTSGRFETFNFRATNSDDENLYIQVTKIGGHILTVSGAGNSDREVEVNYDQAKKIALDFAKSNGIEEGEVVWTDTIYDQTYFNIAPVENGVVIYPDLVKVKVDLTSGTVVGYDATTYFTNHTDRSIGSALVSKDSVAKSVPSDFETTLSRLALVPLEYNREVLCWEFECERGDEVYYFYFNAKTGEEENILKVIKTDDGSKLM